jgi:hypothetical protein
VNPALAEASRALHEALRLDAVRDGDSDRDLGKVLPERLAGGAP